MSRTIEIYDTTLRDGGQALGVNLSLADKLEISKKLDWLGVRFIEGGWPGSNPKDAAYFTAIQEVPLRHATVVAFGSTRHVSHAPQEDANLQQLAQCGAGAVCIFGKSWDLHVREALRVPLEVNLQMIASSIEYLVEQTGRPVFFDAEHFFDGFAADPRYALEAIRAASQAGAERIILCDTNGGALPEQVREVVARVQEELPEVALGIHVHNDGGLAVANTLAAVRSGCVQVQGTINGIGERCGNVDLTAVIANLELKLRHPCLPPDHLPRLTEVSRFVWERLNLVAPLNQPFVGKSAFAHKGGIHVSAMQRNERTYEHVAPASVGNSRRILISEMSGRSNLVARLADRYPQLQDPAVVAAILNEIQERENEGYSFEAADGSFELLVRRQLGESVPAFVLDYYRVHGIGANEGTRPVEAIVKLQVKGEQRLCAAEGNGPVDALSHALQMALTPAFPELSALHVVDYKVRVVNSTDGTAAKVRVLIEHSFQKTRFATLGVNENIIEASWQALMDAVEYALRGGAASQTDATGLPLVSSAPTQH